MLDKLKKLLHLDQTSKNEKLVSALVFFGYIFFTGYHGNRMDETASLFYNELVKPASTPPEWVFPIVWAVLFILIGLTGYRVWNHYDNDKFRKIFSGLYAVNGLLIYLWGQFFFAEQAPTNALFVAVGLIIVAELMILAALRTNKKAAYLLIPYLGWLIFAVYLNTSIIVLNV